MKLTRGKYIIYLDVAPNDSDPRWGKIGKSLTSLSVELNPDVTVEQDILDNTSVTDNGYSPQASLDTFYADPAQSIYPMVKDIAMNRLRGDDCATKILEVLVDIDSGEPYDAWMEDVIIKPTSIGGDTSGTQIPFDIYFDGNRKKGIVTFSAGGYKTGTPTFVEDTPDDDSAI